MEVKISELISEHFGVSVSDINNELELRADLNATDLEIADFFQKLENLYQVNISHDDAQNLKTVGDVVGFITDHVEENS